MRKITSILLLMLLLVACNKKKQQLNLSGTIKNSGGYTAVTVSDGINIDSVKLDKNGTFKTTLKYATGYYFLQYANQNIPIYLQQGDNIIITADGRNFENTLSFKRTESADINRYLLKKHIAKRKILNDLGGYNSLYLYDEQQLLNTMDTLKNSCLNWLKIADLPDSFVVKERKNIRYNYLKALADYPEKYRRWQYRPEYEPSQTFSNRFKNITHNNKSDYQMYPAYKKLVLEKYQQKYFNSLPNSGTMVEKIYQSEIKALPNDFATVLYHKMKKKANITIGLESVILADIGSLTQSNKVLKWIEEQKMLNKLSLVGELSPDFNFENSNGEKTTLSSLRGKVVYIDVWATWCSACRAEFPYLEKIEHLFAGSDVVFVGLSLDKDKDKWLKTVKQLNLGGIQVLSDKDWSSDFVLAYQFGTIPRFILIDKEGYVVNADAPRPSNPNLTKLLEQLLK